MCTWELYMYKQTHLHGNLSIWRKYMYNETGVCMKKIRVFLKEGIICTCGYYLYKDAVYVHGGSLCTWKQCMYIEAI